MDHLTCFFIKHNDEHDIANLIPAFAYGPLAEQSIQIMYSVVIYAECKPCYIPLCVGAIDLGLLGRN
jgi:hypothetical protein